MTASPHAGDSADLSAADHPQQKRPWIPVGVRRVTGYLFPFLILTGQAILVPQTQYSVHETFWLPSQDIVKILLAQVVALVLAIVWITMDSRTLGLHETSINRIKENIVVSWIVAIALWVIFAFLLSRGIAPWYMIIPVLAAPLDGYISADRGSENLYQQDATIIDRTRR
jgi:hypothetical protein